MYINSITWSSLSSAVVCSVTKTKSNGDHWECPLLLFLQPYKRTPVWGKNPKGDGELSGRGFDVRRVGPKKPTWGNVCCWDLPVQNILLASHMNTQTNTLALLISSHARAHRHTHKHPPGLSSSALVSFAWGFPGSKDPFLILQQKHQTKANRMKVQTSSLGYQLCVFRRSQMVAILPKPNVKQKHTLDETNPSSRMQVAQQWAKLSASHSGANICFLLVFFFCILLRRGAFIQDTSLWCQLTFKKNVSFI